MRHPVGPHGGPQLSPSLYPLFPSPAWGGSPRRRPRVNWWLRHTSWGWEQPTAGTLAQREKARRSRLASWLILGVLVGVAILSPLAIDDVRARVTLAIWAAGLLGAAALNRRGWVTLAGIVLVALFSGGILFANLASPIGLTMGELPNFDAYVVSVVLAATVLPRASVFLVAAGNSLLIIGNYMLQPHNPNIKLDAALYSSEAVQTVSLLVRPIALQVVLAVVAFLWVRGAEEAIRRADRAEEVAAWEVRDRERTFALEEGVRYLHQALTQWASGDVRHRIPAMPVVILEQVRTDLNTFIERFSPTMQASFHLYRLQQEVQRLTAALQDWVQGSPVVWPAPSGTPLDRVVALLRFASQSRANPSANSSPDPTAPPRGQFPSGGSTSATGRQTGGPPPADPWSADPLDPTTQPQLENWPLDQSKPPGQQNLGARPWDPAT